jgi:hypothetical protein
MPRSLLVSMLMTVQLLSWSGPSMYLCLASDGSVNVDFGPLGCRCCQRHCEAEASDTHHDDHLCPDHTNHGQQSGSMLGADRDCECSHIQIVQQQGPAVVQKSVKQSDHHAWVPARPIAVLQTQINVIASEVVLSRTSLADSSASVSALRASVVLRC